MIAVTDAPNKRARYDSVRAIAHVAHVVGSEHRGKSVMLVARSQPGWHVFFLCHHRRDGLGKSLGDIRS